MDNEKKQPAEAVEEEPELKPMSTHSKEEDHEHDCREAQEAKKGLVHSEAELETHRLSLHHAQSHVSTHDAAIVHHDHDQHYEAGDESKSTRSHAAAFGHGT